MIGGNSHIVMMCGTCGLNLVEANFSKADWTRGKFHRDHPEVPQVRVVACLVCRQGRHNQVQTAAALRARSVPCATCARPLNSVGPVSNAQLNKNVNERLCVECAASLAEFRRAALAEGEMALS